MEKSKLGDRLVLVTAVLMVVAGCAVRGNVIQCTVPSASEIVAHVLVKDLPQVDPAGSYSSIPAWKDSVERIEEFVSRHEDEPQIINPLRIREAILLLSAGKHIEGAAAFSEIDPTFLSNKRDKALFDIRETLIWWYGIGGENSGFSREDTEKNAKKALENLAAVADRLDRSAATRRLLEQMRVRIANRLAGAMTNLEETRAILRDGLGRYAAQFDPSEYPLIQNWNKEEPKPELVPKLSDLRWYEYVPEAFKQAQAAWAVHVRHGEAPLDIPQWVSCIEDRTCP
jgi:hypothetical protein